MILVGLKHLCRPMVLANFTVQSLAYCQPRENGTYHTVVYEHKTGRQGPAIVTLTKDLMDMLQVYVYTHCSKGNERSLGEENEAGGNVRRTRTANGRPHVADEKQRQCRQPEYKLGKCHRRGADRYGKSDNKQDNLSKQGVMQMQTT